MKRAGATVAWHALATALAAGPVLAAPPPAPAAASYREALAGVADCAAFARAWPALPDARPLLRRLFEQPVLAKQAGEGDDAFMDRAVGRLFDTLGDPSRLHLSVGLAGAGRYDPATGAMILRLPRPFEAALDRWGRTTLRIRGTAPLVTETELRASLDFAPAPPDAIALPMAPADAARFEREGRLELLALFEDYGTDAAHRTAAPGAAAVQTSYRLVRLRPKCALVTVGARALAGWSYDAWAEPGG